MKKWKKIALIFSLAATSVGSVFAAAATIALYTRSAESNGSYGEISLRSYFHSGNGTSKKPYVITRPRHLYNLSRLQSLGVFSDPERANFQLGAEGLGGYAYGCYTADTGYVTTPYLDMTTSTSSHQTIHAIGSESTPFYGTFNGNGLEIKNLHVYCGPQDAGLFGYTAHDSLVHNLFLDNITIHTSGYTKTGDYADLYAAGAYANCGFHYQVPGDEQLTFDLGENVDEQDGISYDATDYFTKDHPTEEDLPANIPTIEIFYPSSSKFRYKALRSGSFLTAPVNGSCTVNIEDVFSHIKGKIDEWDWSKSLQASSYLSLVGSTVVDGLERARVLMTLIFRFELTDKPKENEPVKIQMTVELQSEDHGNNIGLIIGHCDGTCTDCYVHDGSFSMNEGGSSFVHLENNSRLGLIGLVGGTVYNKTAKDSGAGTSEGKSIGVLDFTTIYEDIVPDTDEAFDDYDSTGLTSAVRFGPNTDSKYEKYLRYDGPNESNKGNYVTEKKGAISFRGQRIIKESELGVFTVATDYSNTGLGGFLETGLRNSEITIEDPSIRDGNNDDYYVYYATGEYKKAFHTNRHTNLTFSDYANSLRYSDSLSRTEAKTAMFTGHTLPTVGEMTSESFAEREEHQNYFFRTKLQPAYRSSSKKFYFAEAQSNSFLDQYFAYKCVDSDGHHYVDDDPKNGVMLRNSRGKEIKSFSGSFTTADWSDTDTTKIVCLQSTKTVEGNEVIDLANSPVSNAINFEIKTPYANVTIVAAPNTLGKSAALGVYSLDYDKESTSFPNGSFAMEDGVLFVDKDYNDPDYAFFMPSDDNLAYFDYTLDNGHGKIQTYYGNGFHDVTPNTKASFPASYGYGTEHGYSSNKTRLFVHTFTLKEGRYFLGSPTGANTYDNQDSRFESLDVAKVFYVCAQGQDDGNVGYDDSVHASSDVTENVDFLMQPRFLLDQNGTLLEETIATPYLDENENTQWYTVIPTQDSIESKKLYKKRCYVALDNEKPGSSFLAEAIESGKVPNITFGYVAPANPSADLDTGQFVISTTSISAMKRVSVLSYRYETDDFSPQRKNNITVDLFGTVYAHDLERTGGIRYPVAQSEEEEGE